MRSTRIALLAAALLLALADAAAAAPADGERIGRNLGDLLAVWAGAIFSGLVGLVALIFLVNRRFTDLAVFLAAVVLVGGLIFAPGVVRESVTGIWEAVAGGGARR